MKTLFWYLLMLFNDAVNYWYYITSVLYELHMRLEHWWNDTDRGKQKYSEKSLPQWHLSYYNSHLAWPRTKPRPPRWEAGEWPPDSQHGLLACRVYLYTCTSVSEELAASVYQGSPQRQTKESCSSITLVKSYETTDTDWGDCSWPWQLLSLEKDDRPLFVTSNRCIPVKNTLGWSAVVFCACERIQFCFL
jgi:hypothetical protein